MTGALQLAAYWGGIVAILFALDTAANRRDRRRGRILRSDCPCGLTFYYVAGRRRHCRCGREAVR
jgi:hypothetical protein